MDIYMLLIAGTGINQENTNDGMFCQSLSKGLDLFLGQLQKLDRQNTCQSNSEGISYDDPLVALIQNKHKVNIAISCSDYVESLLRFSDMINTSSWLPYKYKDNKNQLTDSIEQLKETLHSPLRKNDNPCSSIEDIDTFGESLSEHLHRLTNLLPNKGDAVVQVYWILPDIQHLDVRNTLPLFGALKRLQECHNALVEIIIETQEAITDSFLGSWRKWLTFTISDQDTRTLSDVPIWHGSLSYMGQDKRKLESLPGFALNLCHHEDTRTFDLSKVEDRNSSVINKPKMFISAIHLLDFSPRNSIPLFLYLPFKLKLNVLDDHNSNMSTEFIQQLKSKFDKGLCLLACMTMKPAAQEIGKTNLKAWMELVLSSTSDIQQNCSKLAESHCSKRLCVIDRDTEGNVCLFPFRQAESINGGLYEQLENLTRGKKIQDNHFQEGGKINVKDLTKNFFPSHKDKELHYLKHVQSQLEKLVSKDEHLTSEMLCDAMFAAEQRLSKTRSTCLDSDTTLTLELTDSWHLKKDERHIDSSLPCEKQWLLAQDSSRQKITKRSLSCLTDEVSSLSAKDILKRFHPDGRPTKENLSPLRPLNNAILSENYININTNEATIKETCYPESLAKRYHGVEYCLDSSSSLLRDIQLSQTQSSFVKQETLSLSSELFPRAFPKNTRSSVSNKKLEASEKALKRCAKKSDVQKRSVKRKSPSSKQAGKQAKRKRVASPSKSLPTNDDHPKSEETCSSEQPKTKETRSQRHKRRLRLVVEKSLDDNGVRKNDRLYTPCSDRLYSLIKSFLKDLKSSHGLNETMKELAQSNVKQVINFEKTRLQVQEKEKKKSAKSHSKS